MKSWIVKKLDINNFKNSLTDPIDKEIFSRYFCGEDEVTTVEIGDALGMTRQAVEKRLKKMLEQFKKILQ